jgi:acetoin utilization deacetylase AcuC-like enzyme
MTTGIVYDDIYLEHRIGTHVESHERLVAIMNLLKEKKLLEEDGFKMIKPIKADLNQIQYVHEKSLINEVKNLSNLAKSTGHVQSLDMDTLVSPKTYRASLYSVGGNLEAINLILDNEIKNCFALVRPPGHHSNSYKCAGFCIFNNIAIGTEYLFREKNHKKVAIIDWDCHAGNGTADIFYNGSKTGDVVFFSSHQDGRTLYPGTNFIDDIGSGKGAGKIINFPMPPRSADDVIMNFFEEIVKPVLLEFHPEFILISAGFDTHHTDRLTNMGWTYQAPANYLKRIKDLSQDLCNGKILITLEGGYEVDKQAIAVYNCLRILNRQEDLMIKEEEQHSDRDILNYVNKKLIPNLKDKLSPYWNCF